MKTAQHETTERVKVITGIVNSDGTISRGVGFAVSHPAAGWYVIRLNVAPKAILSVVASGHSGTSGMFAVVDTHSGTALGPREFLVKAYTSAVALADTTFGFTATVIP